MTCRAWPMRTVLDRIDAAIVAGERIAIWGDYDADGMTAIVVGSPPSGGSAPIRSATFLAHRRGLRPLGVGLLRPGLAGVTLVVTCDCGVSNAVEVDAAAGMGNDVVITDHHLPPAVLPRAAAVVDPHRPDCAYPDPTSPAPACRTSSRRRCWPAAASALTAWRRSAAIGTVADLAA